MKKKAKPGLGYVVHYRLFGEKRIGTVHSYTGTDRLVVSQKDGSNTELFLHELDSWELPPRRY